MTISGIDGSGKTTLARSLLEALHFEGSNPAYCYGRFVPGLLSILPKVFRRIQYGSDNLGVFPDGYASHRQRLATNPFVHGVIKSCLYPAYIRKAASTLLDLTRNHEIVVCDRYILDTWVLDIQLGSGDPSKSDLYGLRALSRFLPAPDYALMLDVSSETSLERRPNNLPKTLLEEAVRNYRSGAEFLGIDVVDGTRPCELNTRHMLKKIRSL